MDLLSSILEYQMLRIHLSQFLLLVWKLSSVFIIPVIIFSYILVAQSYDQNFNFQSLDQGKNIHKWVVLAIYLAYILVWNRSNKLVISYLKKLEY